ncbi:DUF4038 domain-containing protein [Candidatus Woesearchaeota archaeon]|nr:DUF4038 domain-containing protein [Candidatus Woesearchaeota archaeon]
MSVSADDRHLEDQNGEPFLMIGDTPWSLIVGVTPAEAQLYLDNRKAKGFNTLLINTIEHYFNGPANYAGEIPFNDPNDWSTINEAYWQHADFIIQEALDRDFLLLLTPSYVGYNCGSEGWCAEMKAQTNAQMYAYGEFIANRYKDYPNILWVAGGDVGYAPIMGTAYERMDNVILGMGSIDSTILVTAHTSRNREAAVDYNEPWLDVTNTYTDCDTIERLTKSDYDRTTVRPYFHIEGWYEGEHSTPPSCLVGQALYPLLGGAIGHMFGNNPIWPFNSGWDGSSGIESPGSYMMGHVADLMNSRQWGSFVPDYSHSIVTSGNFDINGDYVAAASNGETVMVYTPSTASFTVDMSQISGSTAQAWWYDPWTGSVTDLGTFSTSGTQSFSAPQGSFVLVLDDASKGFGAPGSIPDRGAITVDAAHPEWFVYEDGSPLFI